MRIGWDELVVGNQPPVNPAWVDELVVGKRASGQCRGRFTVPIADLSALFRYPQYFVKSESIS